MALRRVNIRKFRKDMAAELKDLPFLLVSRGVVVGKVCTQDDEVYTKPKEKRVHKEKVCTQEVYTPETNPVEKVELDLKRVKGSKVSSGCPECRAPFGHRMGCSLG